MLNPTMPDGIRRYLKATALRHLTIPILQAMFDAFIEFTNHVGPDSAQLVILCDYLPRQKVNSVPGDVTAYNNRGNWLNITLLPTWGTPIEFDSYAKEWIHKLLNNFVDLEKLDDRVLEGEEVVHKKGYFNASMGDEKVSIVFGENYPRLRELKRKYDPNCVFRKWFSIVPAEV